MKKFLIIPKGLLTGAISVGITAHTNHIREMDSNIPNSYRKISDRKMVTIGYS